MASRSAAGLTTHAAIITCALGLLSSIAVAFTPSQADRGQQAYDRSCAKCHQADLQGDQVTEAPALIGDTFDAHWAGQPIKELVEKVSTKMPADMPGSLTPSAYLDIVAYILQSNKIAAGTDELTLKPESLAQIIPSTQRSTR
jgi:cytochrome c